MTKFPFKPELVHETAWIAPGAIVRGEVHLHEKSSVWFNAVLRGDTEPLTVGVGSNIQDLSMVHADPGFPAIIGDYVTVGHRAIIHGAKLGDYVLVGMGAIVLNGVTVGEKSIIGAGALLTQNKTFPPRSLILGSPAKVVREITDADIQMIEAGALHYIENAAKHRGD